MLRKSKALKLFELSKALNNKGFNKLALICQSLNKIIASVDISPMANIGNNFCMVHENGIVIGSGVEIGDNCVVYHQVTLGEIMINENPKPLKSPKIGHNVVIYSGAKIVGGVNIGDNCIIGANAVVLKDVPDNCTAVGVPAKIIPNMK